MGSGRQGRVSIRNKENLAIESPVSSFVAPANEVRNFELTKELIALSVRQ